MRHLHPPEHEEERHSRVANVDRGNERVLCGIAQAVADVRVAAEVQRLQQHTAVERDGVQVDLALDILDVHCGVDVLLWVSSVDCGAVSHRRHVGVDIGVDGGRGKRAVQRKRRPVIPNLL